MERDRDSEVVKAKSVIRKRVYVNDEYVVFVHVIVADDEKDFVYVAFDIDVFDKTKTLIMKKSFVHPFERKLDILKRVIDGVDEVVGRLLEELSNSKAANVNIEFDDWLTFTRVRFFVNVLDRFRPSKSSLNPSNVYRRRLR